MSGLTPIEENETVSPNTPTRRKKKKSTSISPDKYKLRDTSQGEPEHPHQN
jgi:hypothetical protein